MNADKKAETNLHAGRYNDKKSAEEYAAHLRSQGHDVFIQEVTVYDVYVCENQNIWLQIGDDE
jgi:hypothetical protein